MTAEDAIRQGGAATWHANNKDGFVPADSPGLVTNFRLDDEASGSTAPVDNAGTTTGVTVNGTPSFVDNAPEFFNGGATTTWDINLLTGAVTQQP